MTTRAGGRRPPRPAPITPDQRQAIADAILRCFAKNRAAERAYFDRLERTGTVEDHKAAEKAATDAMTEMWDIFYGTLGSES
jgi:hypothetical protein